MSLEDLEKKLYQRPVEEGQNDLESAAADLKKENQPAPPKKEEAGSWSGKEDGGGPVYSDNKVLSFFGSGGKIIFWVTLTAVLIALGLGVFYLLQYFKTKDAGFEIKAPAKVLVGEPFEVELTLENKEQDVFRDARMSFKFPDGAAGLDEFANRQIIEENLGDLESGSLTRKKFKVVILASDQSLRRFEVGYSYLPPNLNTRFEKKETLEIVADRPAVSLSLNTPEKVFSGEQFEISAEYKNQTNMDFDEVKLELEYPPQFKFKESSPVSSSSNRVWSGKLPSGGQNNILIKGSATAPDNSFFDIKGKLFVYFGGKPYLIDEKVSNLSISASPLGLAVSVNNNPNYAAVLNDNLTYLFLYKNNTDVALQDVILKIKLSGDMFDFRSLQSSGFFDSSSNTLTWNAASAPELRSLAPGFEGKLSFTVRTKPDYPIKRLFDKNFLLKISAEINSPTVPYNISSDKTVGLASLETKVSGRTEINAFVVPTGKGAFLPKVNKPATYSVKFSVKNFVTDVKDVEVKTILQSGASWTNAVKSNIEAAPEYNSRTGEVVWLIPKIQATKGVIGSPVEASFEIEITPSITQLNQQLPILGRVSLSAIDEFTGAGLTSFLEGIKTIDSVSQ